MGISAQNLLLSVAFLSSGLLASLPGHAVEINFPEEELATESVLPLFDPPDAVKKRNVVMDKKIEFGLSGGYWLNDPFLNPLVAGISAGYHFTEESGIKLEGSYLSKGLTTYSEQLKTRFGYDYSLPPSLTYLAMGYYEWTPFYGKISLTKKGVANLSHNFVIGGGVIGTEDGTLATVGLGIGQKYYFSPRWGLQLNMRSLIYQGPNFASPKTRSLQPSNWTSARPKNSDFEQEAKFQFLLTAGLVFIL